MPNDHIEEENLETDELLEPSLLLCQLDHSIKLYFIFSLGLHERSNIFITFSVNYTFQD